MRGAGPVRSTAASLDTVPGLQRDLRDVVKSQIEALLPAGTRRSYETFRRCSACGQLYWHGAHGDRLQQIVEAAIALRGRAR